MTLSRTLLALLLVGAATAAEPAAAIASPAGIEVYHLADGRRLVGTYDPVSGLLRVAGTVPAAIRVVPDEIVAHRPALAADLPSDRPSTPQERTQRARSAATGALAASQRASDERETMMTIARRRLAEAEARATAADTELTAADAVVLSVDAERRDVQAQRDHVANERALTDLRVRELSLKQTQGGGGPLALPVAPGVEVSVRELTVELSAANRRLTELDKRLAALDRRLVAAQRQRATHRALKSTAETAIAEQEARLAALAEQQDHAAAERERFAAALAGEQAGEAATP